LENSLSWISSLLDAEENEVILLGILSLFTLWFIRNTINYYRAQKRKLRHAHRFAKEGDVLAQKELAMRYRKGDMVKKSCRNAAFWYQKAALSGDEESKDFLRKFVASRKKKC